MTNVATISKMPAINQFISDPSNPNYHSLTKEATNNSRNNILLPNHGGTISKEITSQHPNYLLPHYDSLNSSVSSSSLNYLPRPPSSVSSWNGTLSTVSTSPKNDSMSTNILQSSSNPHTSIQRSQSEVLYRNNSDVVLPSLNLVLNKIQESQHLPLPLPTSGPLPLDSSSSSSSLSVHSIHNHVNNSYSLPRIDSFSFGAPSLSRDISSYSSIHSISKSPSFQTKTPIMPIHTVSNPTSSLYHLPTVPANLVNSNPNGVTIPHKSQISPNNINISLNSEHNISCSPTSLPHSHHILMDNNNDASNTSPKLSSSHISSKDTLSNSRKYVCKICKKAFTTSGHLARHHRIHTGVKNHVCPYEGCNARFSRQDNCMQHYKTHFKSKKGKKKFRL